jgi:hypothetical protein
MNIYRVIFAKNEVLSCMEVSNTTVLNGWYQYEHKNGRLIYAIVQAETEENALTIAHLIIKEVEEQAIGKWHDN